MGCLRQPSCLTARVAHFERIKNGSKATTTSRHRDVTFPDGPPAGQNRLARHDRRGSGNGWRVLRNEGRTLPGRRRLDVPSVDGEETLPATPDQARDPAVRSHSATTRRRPAPCLSRVQTVRHAAKEEKFNADAERIHAEHADGPESGMLLRGGNRTTGRQEPCRYGRPDPICVRPRSSGRICGEPCLASSGAAHCREDSPQLRPYQDPIHQNDSAWPVPSHADPSDGWQHPMHRGRRRSLRCADALAPERAAFPRPGQSAQWQARLHAP